MSQSDHILNQLYIERSYKRPNLSLKEIRRLDEQLGNPSKAVPTVHVAGTNGKGSVSIKIAHALSLKGKKVGLFTSPHIETCLERLQINGKIIEETDFLRLLKKVLPLSDKTGFFDILTLMAFLYFQEQQVDIAVFEVGLGGMFDATNIIEPILTVITTISKDHMAYLGETLEEIAVNKAGIIKPHIPVVLGKRAVYHPMYRAAFACQSPIYFCRGNSDWMEENTEIAKRALAVLLPGVLFDDLSIVPPCRFEMIKKRDLTVVFDVAHNADGFTNLFKRLRKQFPNQKFITLLGMSRDKDHISCISVIKKESSAVYPFIASHPRLLEKGEMELLLEVQHRSVKDVIEEVKNTGAILVVCGSFFIMKEAKEQILLDV